MRRWREDVPEFAERTLALNGAISSHCDRERERERERERDERVASQDPRFTVENASVKRLAERTVAKRFRDFGVKSHA